MNRQEIAFIQADMCTHTDKLSGNQAHGASGGSDGSGVGSRSGVVDCRDGNSNELSGGNNNGDVSA